MKELPLGLVAALPDADSQHFVPQRSLTSRELVQLFCSLGAAMPAADSWHHRVPSLLLPHSAVHHAPFQVVPAVRAAAAAEQASPPALHAGQLPSPHKP